MFIGPWVIIALATGIVYGALGAWWGRSRALMAGIVLGAPFLVEPVLWLLRNGYFKGPVVIWIGEAVVGLAVLAGMAVTSHRARPSSPRVA